MPGPPGLNITQGTYPSNKDGASSGQLPLPWVHGSNVACGTQSGKWGLDGKTSQGPASSVPGSSDGSPDSPREDKVKRARGGTALLPKERREVAPSMSRSPLVRMAASATDRGCPHACAMHTHICVCVQRCWPEYWGGMFTAVSPMCSSMLTHCGAYMLVGEINTLVQGDRRSPIVGLHWSLISSPKKIQFMEGWSRMLVFLPLIVLKL